MEQIKKNWLIIVINTLIALLLVIFTASVNSKYLEAKEYKDKIENLERTKIDRLEFQKKCDDTDTRISTLEKTQFETLNEISKSIQQMATQNASMQTDIAWIKREIDKKRPN